MPTLTLTDVGRRLRACRSSAKLSIDEVAARVGVSRALLYRYEAGDIAKLVTLQKLAQIYGTSAAALLGSGSEYITSGPLFFERLGKLEEDVDHVTTVFGPIAYVLTSDAYEQTLTEALSEASEDGDALGTSEVQRLLRTLRRRKETFRSKRPGIVNIVPVTDIEQYLVAGLSQRNDMPYADRAARRRAATREIEHIASLIASPPMGVQIALTPRPVPTAGFQILRIRKRRVLVNSPFRIGHPLNLRYGVAMISEDEIPLRMHETLATRLWETALIGPKALDEIQKLLKATRS